MNSLADVLKPEASRCTFLSSYGGVYRCRDPLYFMGFCRFHYQCYAEGEIDQHGHISDKLDDQERRRQINFHGLEIPEDLQPSF